jgi:FMN reductase (NADPH)/FMN reductase [NAD(P)H]
MNEVMNVIHKRHSTRAFDTRPVPREAIDALLRATLRAPTAGNMMLYSILEIEDQDIKDKLAVSCDNQPFIAKSPLVLVYLADFQRWYDYFVQSGVVEMCATRKEKIRLPGEGDLLMACNDAVIAAQTTVIAAESLHLASCYIGDILEKYEYHRDLFNLPQYVIPVTMLCLGYPRPEATAPLTTKRFAPEYIIHQNRYHHLDAAELDAMFFESKRSRFVEGASNYGQDFYLRKFASDFSVEMTRSVRKMINSWTGTKKD